VLAPPCRPRTSRPPRALGNRHAAAAAARRQAHHDHHIIPPVDDLGELLAVVLAGLARVLDPLQRPPEDTAVPDVVESELRIEALPPQHLEALQVATLQRLVALAQELDVLARHRPQYRPRPGSQQDRPLVQVLSSLRAPTAQRPETAPREGFRGDTAPSVSARPWRPTARSPSEDVEPSARRRLTLAGPGSAPQHRRHARSRTRPSAHARRDLQAHKAEPSATSGEQSLPGEDWRAGAARRTSGTGRSNTPGRRSSGCRCRRRSRSLSRSRRTVRPAWRAAQQHAPNSRRAGSPRTSSSAVWPGTGMGADVWTASKGPIRAGRAQSCACGRLLLPPAGEA
jgi:hypothetical protein